MSLTLLKITDAHECSTQALFAEVDAHSLAFAGDSVAAKAKICEAIIKHREAINLLVAAIPDPLEGYSS